MVRTIAALVGVVGLAVGAQASELWNNGGFITNPGSPGTSRIEVGGTLLGSGALLSAATAGSARLADDFSIAAGNIWDVTSATFFTYQTGGSATIPSTITGVSVALYSGNPTLGAASLVALTSVPFTSTWTGVYRTVADGSGTTRPIFDVVADLSGLSGFSSLGQGTYYIGWGLTGSLASGPWGVPVAPSASANGILGNLQQNTSPGGWVTAATDGTLGVPSAAFVLNGTVIPAPGVAGLLGFGMLAAVRRRR